MDLDFLCIFHTAAIDMSNHWRAPNSSNIKINDWALNMDFLFLFPVLNCKLVELLKFPANLSFH